MPTKRLIATALLALCSFTPASAQPVRPFSIAALHAAQAKGEPVLVDVFAPWCPTCRAQAPTLAKISTAPEFRKLVILRMDFDHQDQEKKALGVSQQSTLIAFRGYKELARSLGATDPAQIRAIAAAAIK
jgi:thiol-disulfide isomerase/thioredoxin